MKKFQLNQEETSLLCRELAFDDPVTGARRVFRSRRSVLEPAADGTTDTPPPHQT